ncbi:MAG: hypothetical protein HC921_21520 [Synechococcaceae cyanobacterium SM2_3_1]|nr:hypothetical protein [Synechococcaceae cyanobacterium SM2_3_1]
MLTSDHHFSQLENSNFGFAEVWIDSNSDKYHMPYILLLASKSSNPISYIIFDPQKNYQPEFVSDDYEDCKWFLLEDEFTQIQSRFSLEYPAISALAFEDRIKQELLDSNERLISLEGLQASEVYEILRSQRVIYVYISESVRIKVIQTLLSESRLHPENVFIERGYEKYGRYFSDLIGYRIELSGSNKRLYYGQIKMIEGELISSTPRTHGGRTISTAGFEAIQIESVESWIDPYLFPPYILIVFRLSSQKYLVYDPMKDKGEIVFWSHFYQEVIQWLREDGYWLIEGPNFYPIDE